MPEPDVTVSSCCATAAGAAAMTSSKQGGKLQERSMFGLRKRNPSALFCVFPLEVVAVPTLEVFKKSLDNHLSEMV